MVVGGVDRIAVVVLVELEPHRHRCVQWIAAVHAGGLENFLGVAPLAQGDLSRLLMHIDP